MLSSSRFVVAVHVLCILARSAGKGPVCSHHIAESVSTNPVVIRRLMSELEADIYAAVEDTAFFKLHRMDPQSECPIAKQMSTILLPRLRDAEMALSHSLSSTLLSHISEAVH
jgi:Iron-dependent Transcriptional regulator